MSERARIACLWQNWAAVFRGLSFWTAVVVLFAAAAKVSAGEVRKTPAHAERTVSTIRAAKASRASAEPIVAFIDQQIRQGWTDNGVISSPAADDDEWLRRVYLDLIGHIPRWSEVDRFRKDKSPGKRTAKIDKLLDDPGFVRNLTTIWTNLAIGRQTPRRVNRAGMQKFFRESFAENRPWNEVVYDLVAAEGRSNQNGAVNYLLAQLANRDEAVLATAKTTRLFLGIQLQCAQCHNHPFDPWKQEQFWQINSFLRQTRRVDHRRFDAASGQQVDDYSELVSDGFSGPVYFEKRSGEMQVAYPRFFDTKVDPGPETNRRKELAKLMTVGDTPLMARAFVNRTWGHFYGYGFSNPVDDIGSLHPPSHPELLERLSQEFAKNHYDVRKLVRWICNAEAYGLTSRAGKKNVKDDPALGRAPLFSRMYPKALDAEQLYDSLIVATEADQSGQPDWAAAQRLRDEWLQQFIVAFGTDENDETTTFNGTIPQALLMMNGPLIQKATSADKGSFLHAVLSEESSDHRRIQRLYLSTLSRHPNARELTAAQLLIESNPDRLAGYQDLFWALLNSNEFIINH